MNKSCFIFLMAMILGLSSPLFSQEVPFTQDKEQLKRLEAKFEDSQHTIKHCLENIDRPFNVIQNIDRLKEDMQELKTIMFWGFIIIFAEIIIGIILILWNRQRMISYMKQNDFE